MCRSEGEAIARHKYVNKISTKCHRFRRSPFSDAGRALSGPTMVAPGAVLIDRRGDRKETVMSRSGAPLWRSLARSIFVPLFAWLLIAQTILLPLARAEAAVRAGGDAALSILCSSTLPEIGETGDDRGARQVHDFGCCTLGGRLDLDLPVAVLQPPPALPRAEPVVATPTYWLPQGRAPPDITASPRAARAPPSLA